MKFIRNPLKISVLILVIATVTWVPLYNRSPHTLEKELSITAVQDDSDNSLHLKKRVLVFSKADADYDLYEHIRTKCSTIYPPPDFENGSETNRPIEAPLIDATFTKGFSRLFSIDAVDGYTSILVMNYKDHVAVLLIDRY